jgi:hypothetical protein
MRTRPSADNRVNDGIAPAAGNHPNRIQLSMQLDGPVTSSKDPQLAPIVAGNSKAAKAAAPRLSWQTVLRPGGRLSPDLLAIAMGGWTMIWQTSDHLSVCQLMSKCLLTFAGSYALSQGIMDSTLAHCSLLCTHQ